jgi:hypothetical protein
VDLRPPDRSAVHIQLVLQRHGFELEGRPWPEQTDDEDEQGMHDGLSSAKIVAWLSHAARFLSPYS